MNWLCFVVTQEMEQEAQAIRSERDNKYGNIYTESDSDICWSGDLGEICFNSWLQSQNIRDYKWILDDVSGEPDFYINGISVDIKTVKRRGAPKPNYTAQITAKHKDTPVDHLFFCTYEFQRRKMWFLGGVEKSEFLSKATYYGAGERVHQFYTVRKGHEILNAPVGILEHPENWLKFLVKPKKESVS